MIKSIFQTLLLASFAQLLTVRVTAFSPDVPVVLSLGAFKRLTEAASKVSRTLYLRGRHVDLGEEDVILSSSGLLSIKGPGHIFGSGHTLFSVGGNRQTLALEGLSLKHLSSDTRILKREQGAAIWARGKAEVAIKNCTVSSACGYGIWLVQRAKLRAENSAIEDCGRSGVVSFGQGNIIIINSAIRRAKLHGICVRGSSTVLVRDSRVEGCGVRGIYAYHNSSLEMSNSTVSGTRAEFASAIQIEALRSGDQARISLSRCDLHSNAGFGLSVAGNVECSLEGIVAESNLAATEQLSLHEDFENSRSILQPNPA